MFALKLGLTFESCGGGGVSLELQPNDEGDFY